jgi:hypothetical protein
VATQLAPLVITGFAARISGSNDLFCARLDKSDLLLVSMVETGLETTRKELAVIKKSADAAYEFAQSVINTVRELLIFLDQDLKVVSQSIILRFFPGSEILI